MNQSVVDLFRRQLGDLEIELESDITTLFIIQEWLDLDRNPRIRSEYAKEIRGIIDRAYRRVLRYAEIEANRLARNEDVFGYVSLLNRVKSVDDNSTLERFARSQGLEYTYRLVDGRKLLKAFAIYELISPN